MKSVLSAFRGNFLIVSGAPEEVFSIVLTFPQADRDNLLFFDHSTGRQTDFDLRGPLAEILARVEPAPKAGRGRPKLGVVSTEVTLLPRHWEWLNAQPGRASATLRRLVEDAMTAQAADPRMRLEALGKILWALAGNEPGFEEASRALYAGDRARLELLSSQWSGDLPQLVKEWE